MRIGGGIANKDIDLAINLAGFRDQGLHLFLVRNVAGNGDGLTACIPDRLCDFFTNIALA